jgi:putative spermidine/putrescine transport system permease protein
MPSAATTEAPLLTADGRPLKESLTKALRRNRLISLGLVSIPFLFLFFAFLWPIAEMLYRSVENTIVSDILPKSSAALVEWDDRSDELPGEAAFAALVADFQKAAKEKTIGKVGRRLNYEKPGMSSLFRSTARKAKKITEPPYKEALLKSDKKWADIDTWRLLKRESGAFTFSYYLAAIDKRFGDLGSIENQPENRQIYVKLFWRTIWISLVITVICIVLAYPVSYLLATLPLRTSNLLMILVLLPFWTSLLVRTTAWIALLQKEGVINDVLVWVGVLSEEGRLQMIHNQTGTIVAMTYVLLPFMILPLYSVMKTIPPSYMRAAKSLGATPFTAFVRVYMPQTVSGIGAGSILVFILAIGYYITPELVGGTDGTLISNFIAYHMSTSLNWGLAAALGTLLLALVMVLFVLYDKIVGVNNMKLG